jgi:Txe/YoeB family toxin of toxin-antitoxin system
VSNYSVRIKNSCKPDLKNIKHSNLKEGFDEIVKTLRNNPYEPTQSFEKLQPYTEKYYSRRINAQHRVVYKIDESKKIVEIYAAWSHYKR